MKRINGNPRPGWKAFAESVGFNFHTFDGEPYWDETAYYQFTLSQIEQIWKLQPKSCIRWRWI